MNSMRDELERQLRDSFDALGGAAREAARETGEQIRAEYDRLTAEGKTPLEAYRALLEDVEKMRAILQQTKTQTQASPGAAAAHTKETPPKNAAGQESAGAAADAYAGYTPYTPPPAEDAQYYTGKEMQRHRVKAITGSLQSILWLSTVLLYFAISFKTGAWHLTWLLFLSASAGSILIGILKEYNLGKPLLRCGGWSGMLWLLVTTAYFLVSFVTGAWHLTWLLFVFASLIQSIFNTWKKLQ